LILSRGDGQVRDADPQARDSNLPQVHDRELDDGGVARGDQRLVGPGREIFLDCQDPALAHADLEGGIISFEAINKRGNGSRPGSRPRLRQFQSGKFGGDALLQAVSEREKLGVALLARTRRQRPGQRLAALHRLSQELRSHESSETRQDRRCE